MATPWGGGNQSGFGVRNNTHEDLESHFCPQVSSVLSRDPLTCCTQSHVFSFCLAVLHFPPPRDAARHWKGGGFNMGPQLRSCFLVLLLSIVQCHSIEKYRDMFIPSESENIKLI